MHKTPISQGEAYYKSVGEKNLEKVSAFLAQDVEFYSPMATLQGKEAVTTATSHFMDAISSLTIRAKFGDEHEALIVYEVAIPGVSNAFPGASWLRFKDDKIVRIQLFYDASLMQQKKKEIFS